MNQPDQFLETDPLILQEIMDAAAWDTEEDPSDETMVPFTYKVPPGLKAAAEEILKGNSVRSTSKFIRKVFERLVLECQG